jgi:transposase
VAKVSAINQLKALIVGAPEELRAELERLVTAMAPWLLELAGVGPMGAAQLLVSWSHAGRLRSEAAALHTVVVARLRADPDTRADAARRTAVGKSIRDIRRCLKRAVARQLFKLLERHDRPGIEVLNA